MEGIIDTSVLVDYILPESQRHEKAKEAMGKIDRGFLPTVVVEELVYVLERLEFDKKAINEKIRQVLDSYDLLGVSAANIAGSASYIMEENGATFRQFEDKLILSIAKDEGMALLTFDKRLAKECKAHGVKLLYE